jgi:hypothetical protein
MIGRDYEFIATNGSVFAYFGDNRGNPYPGPGRLKYIDKNHFGVMDVENGLHVQTLGGSVLAHIVPQKKKEKKNPGDKTKPQEPAGASEFDQDANANYMEIAFADFCPVPLTKSLAVADKLSNTIRIVGMEDWSIERTFGQNVDGTTEFGRISGISSFQLGFKTFYCACEIDSDRVMILSEGGRMVETIGQPGIMPGEFDKPVAIASCVMKHHADAYNDPTPPRPSWYLGAKHASSCDTAVRHFQDIRGTFYVCSRPQTEGLFDVSYIAASGTITRSNIRASRDSETDELAMSMVLAGGVKLKSWPSVAHVVRNFKEFHKV